MARYVESNAVKKWKKRIKENPYKCAFLPEDILADKNAVKAILKACGEAYKYLPDDVKASIAFAKYGIKAGCRTDDIPMLIRRNPNFYDALFQDNEQIQEASDEILMEGYEYDGIRIEQVPDMTRGGYEGDGVYNYNSAYGLYAVMSYSSADDIKELVINVQNIAEKVEIEDREYLQLVEDRLNEDTGYGVIIDIVTKYVTEHPEYKAASLYQMLCDIYKTDISYENFIGEGERFATKTEAEKEITENLEKQLEQMKASLIENAVKVDDWLRNKLKKNINLMRAGNLENGKIYDEVKDNEFRKSTGLLTDLNGSMERMAYAIRKLGNVSSLVEDDEFEFAATPRAVGEVLSQILKREIDKCIENKDKNPKLISFNLMTPAQKMKILNMGEEDIEWVRLALQTIDTKGETRLSNYNIANALVRERNASIDIERLTTDMMRPLWAINQLEAFDDKERKKMQTAYVNAALKDEGKPDYGKDSYEIYMHTNLLRYATQTQLHDFKYVTEMVRKKPENLKYLPVGIQKNVLRSLVPYRRGIFKYAASEVRKDKAFVKELSDRLSKLIDEGKVKGDLWNSFMNDVPHGSIEEFSLADSVEFEE